MEIRKNGILLSCVHGDITKQEEIDVVVNAANAELKPGGGVAGVIHRAAGPELLEACRPKAPIRPGEAVITEGYNLPNRYIIHTLGPVYGLDQQQEELLEKCYVNALQLAELEGLTRIAFPAISTGAFGYPFQKAMEIALPAVLKMTEKLMVVNEIRFVLYSRKELEMYEDYLSSI